MAPEQVRCEEIDAPADLFSLGSVVFFMLTGRSPFQGRSSGETMTKIIEEKPPRLKDLVIHNHPHWAEGMAKEASLYAMQRLNAKRMARDYENLFLNLLAARSREHA